MPTNDGALENALNAIRYLSASELMQLNLVIIDRIDLLVEKAKNSTTEEF